MKLYVRATYAMNKRGRDEATKKFIAYVKEKGFPFADDGDDWNTTVVVDCEDGKVPEFIKKLCQKFKCKAIVEPEKRGAKTMDVSIWQDPAAFKK